MNSHTLRLSAFLFIIILIYLLTSVLLVNNTVSNANEFSNNSYEIILASEDPFSCNTLACYIVGTHPWTFGAIEAEACIPAGKYHNCHYTGSARCEQSACMPAP